MVGDSVWWLVWWAEVAGVATQGCWQEARIVAKQGRGLLWLL